MADLKKKEDAAPAADGIVAGLKAYQLTEKHYRNGVMYEAGMRIAVRDEKPGRSWRPIPYDESIPVVTREAVVDKSGPGPVVPVQLLGRPSDRSV